MSTRSHERGAVLIVALVLLIAMTLLALSAYNTSVTDLKTVGNMQVRNEAFNAAQETLETAISSTKFVTDAANALPNPCGGAANTFCTDYNGDGVAEYTTRLVPSPACVSVKMVKMAELDLAAADDLACAASQSQQFGVAGSDATAGDSLCANTTWQLTAQASSATSGAKVTVTQGLGIRIGADDMASSCL